MDPLQELRDIHLPEPVSFWPLAPIWYLLFALLLAVIAAVVFYCYKRTKQLRLKKNALKKLAEIKQTKNPTKQILQLSELIRRVAIKVYARENVASLQGNEWLLWLDKGVDSTEFSQGPGAVISTIPYQKIPAKNMDRQQIDAIVNLTQKWLQNVTKRGHHV